MIENQIFYYYLRDTFYYNTSSNDTKVLSNEHFLLQVILQSGIRQPFFYTKWTIIETVIFNILFVSG